MGLGIPAHYISSGDEFSSLCRKWQSSTAIALDTEFTRTNTFYAKIGLLQIADEANVYLIDPLDIDNWDEFRVLLSCSSCQIVVHSAGEDLNLLLTHVGCLPRNLFDTQLAAAFLGLGFSLSYQALVEQRMGIVVEKGETRSDWLKRPLSDKQLQYAANDVLYLLDMASYLRDSLSTQNRLSWFESECALLLSSAEQVEDESSWRKLYTGVSNAWKLGDVELGYLRSLCLWREIESRNRNRPRNWVAKDSDLQVIAVTVARNNNLSVEGIRSAKVEDQKLLHRYAETFVELLAREKENDSPVDRTNLNYPLEPAARKTLKAMQQLVETRATEFQVAPELLGRKKQLLELMRQYRRDGKFEWAGKNNDWREGLLKEDFTRLLQEGLD